MGERPRIAIVDDPLEAGAGTARKARRPAPRTPAASEEPSQTSNGRAASRTEQRQESAPARSTAPDLAAEALVGVFGRVPASLARRLEGMVFQLRAERKVSQQDVLAALLLRYVDHSDERSVAEMHRLLDGYEKVREPRRSRTTHSA